MGLCHASEQPQKAQDVQEDIEHGNSNQWEPCDQEAKPTLGERATAINDHSEGENRCRLNAADAEEISIVNQRRP